METIQEAKARMEDIVIHIPTGQMTSIQQYKEDENGNALITAALQFYPTQFLPSTEFRDLEYEDAVRALR